MAGLCSVVIFQPSFSSATSFSSLTFLPSTLPTYASPYTQHQLVLAPSPAPIVNLFMLVQVFPFLPSISCLRLTRTIH
ncbi:hypothetical protein F5X98DRAFT_230620 [Xylaria grammica]|nr:hypothetical protein F5X98DRAFT_230620 [Xylaria grammica]